MRLKQLLLSLGLAATSIIAANPRAKATTCPNATAITSLPVTNQSLVCGTTNDQSATTVVPSCNGSTVYYGGLEALYTFTPTITGTVRVEYTGQTWAGIFVFSGCPSTTGTTMVACTTSSTASKFVDVTVTSGTTYYLMFDTWPSPASPCTGTFSILLPCNGVPTAGTASATVTSTCTGGTSVLSLAGQSAGPGISYQWQSSTTGTTGPFTNVGGATAASYTTPALSATTYYRAIIKCTTTGDSVFSNPLTVTVAAPTTTTAAIPYSQSFENWISSCSVTDRPGTEWTTNPFNGDAAWRRDDQGASAAWNSAAFGIYTPVSTAGARSARFHSYYTSGQGSMMLNVNLSPVGPKVISFDYNNTSGTDSLYVELSTNGGTTWTVLAALGTTTGWAAQNVATTSTAAAAMIRFRGKGDFGFSTDIGMDNLNIAVVTCPLPTAVNATAVTGTTATVGWTAPSPAPGIGYRWELRTSGAAGSGGVGLVNSGNLSNTTTSLPLTGLTGTTSYTFYVRAVCAAGDSSVWASVGFVTSVDCAGAPNIPSCNVFQSFTIPAGTGSWGPYIQTPTGNAPYQTPGIERIYTFTAPVTGVYTLDVTVTNSAWADYFVKPVAAGACVNANWIFWDDMFSPGQDTITLIGGTQYYILIDPETGATPAQTFRILCPPTCGAPNTVNVTTSTNSATIGWTQPALGSPASWQISYGTGIATPAAGTLVIASTNPWTITGLTPATNYTFYVRAICGPGDTSAWSLATTTATQCLPSTLPFVENFNTVLPVCWQRAIGSLGATNSALTYPAFNSWTSDGYMNNGFTGAAKINLWLGSKRDWMITPSIDLGTTTPSNYVLEFNMGVTQFGSTTVLDTLGSDDTVAVVVSYDNGTTWNLANALRIWTAADDTIGGMRYYLPFVDSGLVKIGFYGSEGVIDNVEDNDIFFDSVRITQCTVPTVALGNDTTLCGAGATLTLNAGPGTSYIWSTGDTSQSIIIGNPGQYTVTVFNGGPGCSKRDTINVTTGVLPVVNLGQDTSICGNVTSFQLNAGNPLSTYLWSSPAANLSIFSTQIIDLAPIINAGNITNSGSPTNTAPVIVAVTNPTGCTGYDTVNVSVIFTARVSDINITGTDPTFSFTPVLDSFATTYAWNFGDGTAVVNTTSATPPVTHTYATNGNYTVTLRVGNQCGITDTVTKQRQVTNDVNDVTADGTTITLYPNPTAADAVLTVDGNAKLRSYQILNAAGAVVAERNVDGVNRATISTGSFAAGVYTLRIQLDKGVVVRKLEVIK